MRGGLESCDKFAVAAGDFTDGSLARRLPATPVREGIPKDRSADGKADEAGDAGGRCQPLPHLGLVLATPENDTADESAPVGPRCRHDLFAIFASVETLYLPHVRIDAGTLQLVDGADHQLRAQFPI